MRAGLVGILLVAGALPMGAGAPEPLEPLTLKATPAVAFAPATLVVRATIAADARNRAIEVSADSEDFFRSSAIELEGDRAPRTKVFEFRSLPPGAYEVRVRLIGDDGHERARARQEVQIIATGGERSR
jgi:methionine-rich copper-binding protein CopC